MAAKDSSKDIYELVDRMRREGKDDLAAAVSTLSVAIGKLDQKFESLEQGRVADVEKEIGNLRVKQATAGVKLAVLGFIGSTIAGAIVSSLVTKWVS